MKNKPLVVLGVLALSVLALAGCGGASGSGSGTSVVASFYPFAYVAEQVGGSKVDVQNLTHAGVEPHDLELKPRQIGAVQDADLVIYEKNFQAAVDDAVGQADLPGSKKVDIADVVTLKKTADEEAQEHADEGIDEHNDEQEHSGGGVDPHVWLDPRNMIAITKAVEAKLSSVDGDNAATYKANAAAFEAKLTALDQEFRTGLSSCRIKQVVTSHAAFAYLADEYGLEQVSIAGIDPTNEPSGKQLADIAAMVKRDGITTVFTEELVSPKIADTIAHETGATTATLSPIEGLTDKTEHETYLTLMHANLAALRKANDC